jgi:hypothetical protein
MFITVVTQTRLSNCRVSFKSAVLGMSIPIVYECQDVCKLVLLPSSGLDDSKQNLVQGLRESALRELTEYVFCHIRIA